MLLSDVSIKRPVFATMMMVALVVLGVVSYQRLAVDEYPDVTYPVVVVQTTWPGTSPEVMEREVSRPIEEAVNTVQGLDELTSTSYEGASMVRVQLELGVDVAEAQQDVQAKVARIRRELPPEVEEPLIIRFDPNQRPIMSIAIQSRERPLRELTDLADEVISTRIETVRGVGEVRVVGGDEREIRIQLDPDALRAYRIGPPQVIDALRRENQEVPAGRVTQGESERLIRVTGRVEDPMAFAGITVAVREGVPVKLGDLATVVDGTADRRSAALINGSPAVSLDILKIVGSNTVEVSDGVRALVAELEAELPDDIRLTITEDDSERIRESLAAVQHELILGAVLTITVIYLFLNSWRSTVITGLALPISMISAFFVMWLFGFTVNTMTLLALSLAIGLLIDDAIVVRENIVRHMEMGKDHVRASRDGTSEIGLAVTSTTLAVIAVFIPVAFMGGQIGLIFFQFGVTVAFAVLVSLFVSFTLDPMLSSVWRDPEVEGHGTRKNQALGDAEALGARRSAFDPATPPNAKRLTPGVPPSAERRAPDSSERRAPDSSKRRLPIKRLAQAFNNRFERIADRYPRWLGWALGHRMIVVGVALVSVVGALALVPQLGFSWMPETDGGEFRVNFRTPPGSSLQYSVAKAEEVAEMIRGEPDVAYTYTSVGGGFRGTPSNGRIYVRLEEERDRTQDEFITALRAKLRTIPGIQPNITGTPTIFGGWRQPIVISVRGPEPTRLEIAAQQVLETIRGVPGIAEPNSSDEGDIPQLDVHVDRQQAWAAGVGVDAIGSTLQPLFAGQDATQWEDPLGYSHDVVVVYPDSLRTSAADVASIGVPSENIDPRTGAAAMIPLSQVADVRAGVGPQQIERSSLERQISISAGVLPGYSMGDVANAARAAIDQIGLPPGYRAVFQGDVERMEETKGFVLEALILAVIFIYLILASLFGSFTQPLAIMLALPLSFIGAALALLITGGDLNVMTMIGIIMLMGLVTKNGILLVDFSNRQRADGLDRREALLVAGRARLRPIIMTTVAMIFGMLPLALALGEGSEQRAPMARAVIGGLITSTLLTLFVVPVVYTLLDDAIAFVRRKREWPRDVVPEPAAGD